MDNNHTEQQTLEQQMPQSPAAAPVNPLLAAVKLPGITVRLPSGGQLYTPNVISQKVIDNGGEIHVSPMTGIDEVTLKSPDKLLSGDAIREVFARCIPDVLNVDEMFAKDIDLLMVGLRIASYGREYEVPFKHDCEEATKRSYIVDVNQFLTNSVSLDPTSVKQTYKMTLESTGQTIHFRPLQFKDVIKVMDSAGADRNSEQQQLAGLFDSILSVIHNVDGIGEDQLILEWLSTLPVLEVKAIMSRIEEISNWGPTYTHTVTCGDCGEELELTIPINPLNFFT